MKLDSRKALLLVVWMVCLPTFSFAFDLAAGAKFGLTFPWYGGDDYWVFRESWAIEEAWLGSEPAVGLSGGVFVTVGLTDWLCVQPEIFFSQLGGNCGEYWYVFKDKVNGVDIHALVKLRLTARRFRFYPFAGPTVFVPLGPNEIRIVDRYSSVTVAKLIWADSAIRVPVFGATAGAGVEWLLGSLLCSLDVRYIQSLQSRFTDDSGLADWIQHGVQVMVGVASIVAGQRPKTTAIR